MFNKFLILVLIFTSMIFAKNTHVKGYYKKNGTYVQPHYRSAPDGNFYNNWSTKGNINPYTGKVGSKEYPSTNHGYLRTPTTYEEMSVSNDILYEQTRKEFNSTFNINPYYEHQITKQEKIQILNEQYEERKETVILIGGGIGVILFIGIMASIGNSINH